MRTRAAAGQGLEAAAPPAGSHWATAYAGFSAVRIGHGSYRKQLLWPAKDTDSFAGSCSFQGQVKFDPPATNTQQQLRSSYDATGTCDGKLDGRSVSKAPAKMGCLPLHNSF